MKLEKRLNAITGCFDWAVLEWYNPRSPRLTGESDCSGWPRSSHWGPYHSRLCSFNWSGNKPLEAQLAEFRYVAPSIWKHLVSDTGDSVPSIKANWWVLELHKLISSLLFSDTSVEDLRHQTYPNIGSSATLYKITLWPFSAVSIYALRYKLLNATSREFSWLQEMSQRAPPYNGRQCELKTWGSNDKNACA